MLMTSVPVFKRSLQTSSNLPWVVQRQAPFTHSIKYVPESQCESIA